MQISNEIPFDQVNILHEKFGRRAILKSISIKEVDDVSCRDAESLLTEYDDESQEILKSVRYSNEDVANFGWGQVLEWISEDKVRYDDFGHKWWYVGLQVEAEIVISTDESPIYTSQTLKGGYLGGVESDGIESAMGCYGPDYIQEMAQMLGVLNVVIPEQLNGCFTQSEEWITEETGFSCSSSK